MTSVGSGAGLTGGPITTSGTLSIATAGVTNTMLQHSSLTLTPGTGLTGAGAMSLGNTYNLNIDTTKIPLLSSNNTFTATQNFTGNPGITVNNTSADGIESRRLWNCSVWIQFFQHRRRGFSNGFDGGVFEASSTGAYGSRSDSFVEAPSTPALPDGNMDRRKRTLESGAMPEAASASACIAKRMAPVLRAQSAAAGFYPIGVWADTSGIPRAVILASAALTTVDNGWSIVSYSNSLDSTVFLENEEIDHVSSALVMETVGGNFGGVCTIDVSGNLYCTGSKSAVVPVDGGSKKVALYAIEAPENWFEDAGSGQLSNGSAVINLENMFGQSVNTALTITFS